jgi:lycopene beta-cyclase
MTADVDVVVVGAGPAGWAAAAAIAMAGLEVTLVAPLTDGPWPGVYGAWTDEVSGLGLGEILRATWPKPIVVGNERHELDRPFGLVDNAVLRSAFHDQLTAGAGSAVAGWVVGSNHDRWRSTVVLSDGRIFSGRVIVDASGADAALVQRPKRPRPAMQTTHAVIARRPSPSDPCVLMDLSGGPDHDAEPTYLTAIDAGDGTTMVAETSLLRRPELPADVVTHRLDARLAAWGVDDAAVLASKSGCEPVVLARPAPIQREVGFGAAAAQVHPLATLGTTLRAAPLLATALADALVGRRATPAAASRAAWDAVWPHARGRARQVEQHGLEALARLDRGGQCRFIDGLFALDQDQWTGYLAGTLAPREVGSLLGTLLGRRRVALAHR